MERNSGTNRASDSSILSGSTDQKKKKKLLKPNNTQGNLNWARRSIRAPVVWIPDYHSWEADTVQHRSCPLTVLQFIFSFQVTRGSPAWVVATLLRLLCKLKGTLAWTGQPSANNPRLGETAPCSPGKHKHLLVTHSNQKWPTRRETSPQRQKRKQAALQLSFFLIHPLTVRGH